VQMSRISTLRTRYKLLYEIPGDVIIPFFAVNVSRVPSRNPGGPCAGSGAVNEYLVATSKELDSTNDLIFIAVAGHTDTFLRCEY